MKTKDKIIILISGAILFCSCNQVNSEIKGRQMVKKCKQLKIGMTRQQVIEIMGVSGGSAQAGEGDTIETLVFSPPFMASTFPQCDIDKQKNKVVSITCDESYELNSDGLNH